MKILNHRLCTDDGTPYDFIRSPNQSGVINPEYLIMHYTAGRSAQSSINWLINPHAWASAHLVIGTDGSITQLVAFNRKAWHAGRSRWAGRSGVNNFSIGIELDNPGVLTRRGGSWFTTWGDRVDDEDVIEAVHKNGGELRGWHAYSVDLLETAVEVASLLVQRYGLKDVLGHEDIAPARKTDPGPAFPMDSFQARVLGRQDDEPEIFETIVGLNIRRGAGTQYEKLPMSPLTAGTRLEVLSQQGAWRLVDVLDPIQNEYDINGWVHGRYIRRVN
jgi:N-acetylmuramoyl-L-alanine amidase